MLRVSVRMSILISFATVSGPSCVTNSSEMTEMRGQASTTERKGGGGEEVSARRDRRGRGQGRSPEEINGVSSRFSGGIFCDI
jgi:hypothetical protein